MTLLAGIVLGTRAIFYKDRGALELLIGALPFSCKAIKVNQDQD
jgi:hypothetical protein